MTHNPLTDEGMRLMFEEECASRNLLPSDKGSRAYEPIAAVMRRIRDQSLSSVGQEAASPKVQIDKEMVERATAAMKRFIETPLVNNSQPPSSIDLTRVSAGSLGDVLADIARAALLAALTPEQEG